MVLIDFSHLVFRMLHVSINETKPKKKDGKLVTDDFKDIMVYKIVQQLIYIKKTLTKYGDLVICLDNNSKRYWRKDVCPLYKGQRAKAREESEINFTEVFAVISDLLEKFREFFPFKIIEVEGAEADDIIIVLAKTFANSNERVLIFSEDKDFFQMLKYNFVDFYRPVAKKFVTTADKDMDKWLVEHVCLGDESDNVFRIIDKIHFSENFIKHLMTFGIFEKDCQMKLDMYLLENDVLRENIYSSFSIYKLNRKGESTGELDIYKNQNFGEATLWKTIDKFGSLDSWIDSHPYYRKNYEKNKILVLEEHIPEYIADNILDAFNTPQKSYSQPDIEVFFKSYQLNKLIPEIPILLRGFTSKKMITAEDLAWDW